MAKEVLKQIYDCLRDAGFQVYFPTQHKGECISNYIVIKNDGTLDVEGLSSERPLYSIMLYVPQNNYSDLEQFRNDVIEAMKNVFPLVRYIGNETSAFYDDIIKGHMISFQYAGQRKINHWNF